MGWFMLESIRDRRLDWADKEVAPIRDNILQVVDVKSFSKKLGGGGVNGDELRRETVRY